MSEIKVKCPCCNAALIIDAETSTVLHHKAHKEPVQSLGDFLKNEKTRNDDLAAMFAAGKEKEDSKMKILDKKFEWAKKNKDKLPEAKPGIQWD